MAAGAIFALAAGVKMYGDYKANQDEAKAHRANAAAIQAQKHAAEVAAKRELQIFEDESDQYVGSMVTNIARSGVSLEGSSLMVIAQEQASIDAEYRAISFQAKERAKLFDMQAAASLTSAKRASDPMNNLLQAAGTATSAVGQYYAGQDASSGVQGKSAIAPSTVSPAAKSTLVPNGTYAGGGTSYVYDSTQPWKRKY